jgi:heme/copper-type cytochrome/quinol oxidase subunit 1
MFCVGNLVIVFAMLATGILVFVVWAYHSQCVDAYIRAYFT